MVKSSGPIGFATDRTAFPVGRARRRAREGGQSVVLALIVLAIFGGLGWWLFSARQDSEREAKAFAREVAARVAVHHDQKFLDRNIAPERMTQYPPSYRERMIQKCRGFGTPEIVADVEGNLVFTSYFFQPFGRYRATLQYPEMRAFIDVAISRPRGWWQIDDMNLVWEPPPPPPPPPSAPPGVE